MRTRRRDALPRDASVRFPSARSTGRCRFACSRIQADGQPPAPATPALIGRSHETASAVGACDDDAAHRPRPVAGYSARNQQPAALASRHFLFLFASRFPGPTPTHAGATHQLTPRNVRQTSAASAALAQPPSGAWSQGGPRGSKRVADRQRSPARRRCSRHCEEPSKRTFRI